MEQTLSVEWHDAGREPECQPNPAFPEGKDMDVSEGAPRTCYSELPYPARRCGVYVVACSKCGLRIGVTTAGRPDDPRSVKVACINYPH